MPSMNPSTVLLFLFLGVLVLFTNVNASVGRRKDEAYAVDKQLKRLRIPAIKTVTTQVGDTYDCVDIRKQPSLNHPLLQNHKIQMRPSFLRKGSLVKSSLSNEVKGKQNLVTVDCPKGTVPIRRMEREDLIRANSFTKSYLSRMHPQTPDFPGQHYAMVRSKRPYNGKFVAMQASLSLHTLNITAHQSSSAHMWMERDPESLQTGWMVSPQLYGDTHTRLFTFRKTKDGGCFNLLCDPGFVQVHQNCPVDVVFNETSVYDVDQYVIPIAIEKDPKTQCWWLRIHEDVNIGYWPSGTLPNLDRDGANYVAWGGFTTTSPPDALSPPMGYGEFQHGNFEDSAYIYQLKIVDPSSNTWLNPHEDDLESFVSYGKCFDLKYFGYQGKDLGHTLMYGGPGGRCGI